MPPAEARFSVCARTRTTAHSGFAENEIRAALSDHNGRRIGVARNQCWHDGCVDHAQSANTVHAQFIVDNCHAI